MGFSRQEYWSRVPSPSPAWALGHENFTSCGSQALEHRLSSCSVQALLSMWDPPGSGIEPVSPSLTMTSSFLTKLTIPGNFLVVQWLADFPGGSDSKASVYNAGDPGSIPGLGRSPGEGNGNPLQYSCLENPMEGGAS